MLIEALEIGEAPYYNLEVGDTKLITLYLPEAYIKALDWLVDERFYPSRAEAIRTAIRDLLSDEVWRKRRFDLYAELNGRVKEKRGGEARPQPANPS